MLLSHPADIYFDPPTIMSEMASIEQTFASGRYSKRKRTQINYQMGELDVSEAESDFESVTPKVVL